MIVAISPAAKYSPIMIEDMIARDTSKSALISNSLIKPSIHSLNMDVPHNMIAIHDKLFIDKMKLVNRLMVDITINIRFIFSCLSNVRFMLTAPHSIDIPHRVYMKFKKN